MSRSTHYRSFWRRDEHQKFSYLLSYLLTGIFKPLLSALIEIQEGRIEVIGIGCHSARRSSEAVTSFPVAATITKCRCDHAWRVDVGQVSDRWALWSPTDVTITSRRTESWTPKVINKTRQKSTANCMPLPLWPLTFGKRLLYPWPLNPWLWKSNQLVVRL